MDTKNMVGSIVALAVVIVCVAAIMMPILSEATLTTKTFDNSDVARYQMKELENGDAWTYSDSAWYYDGEILTTNNTSNYSILFTDNLALREAGSIRSITNWAGIGSTSSVDVVEVDASTLGLSINENTTYISFDYGYGAVQEGDLIMKTYNDEGYVLGDTVMYVTGTTTISGQDIVCAIYGSIEDGFTVTATVAKSAAATNITVGEITVTAESVEDCANLYKFTGISFDLSATVNNTEHTLTANYGTFVMPKEVTTTYLNPLNEGQRALLNAIPAIIIASVMVAAVGVFVVAKRD